MNYIHVIKEIHVIKDAKSDSENSFHVSHTVFAKDTSIQPGLARLNVG